MSECLSVSVSIRSRYLLYHNKNFNFINNKKVFIYFEKKKSYKEKFKACVFIYIEKTRTKIYNVSGVKNLYILITKNKISKISKFYLYECLYKKIHFVYVYVFLCYPTITHNNVFFYQQKQKRKNQTLILLRLYQYFFYGVLCFLSTSTKNKISD